MAFEYTFKSKTVIEDGIEYTVKYNFQREDWYVGGKLHRESGPAVGYVGNIYQEWWYHGIFLQNVGSQEEFILWKKLKVFT